MRGALLSLIALLALALPTSAPAASYDPLGSGTAKLTLDPSFASFLKQAGVKLSASQGARQSRSTYALPIVGGQIEPLEGKGEAQAEGTLIFQSAKGKVPLRQIRVKSSRTPLIAKVGGSQLKVAASKQTKATRQGFGTKLSAAKLTLTQKAITRLNKKLRPKAPFTPNQPLGKLIANAQPKLIAIEERGTATLSLDAAFLQKLDARFVSLNPIAPAQRFGAQATFPIAIGGAIAPNGSEGTHRTAGALEFLQLGAGQVFLGELWLDLGANSDTAEVDVEPTPSFPGKIGRVGVFDYAPAPVSSDPKQRTISVSGARLSLSAQAAATYNEAYAQGEGEVFGAGESVGGLGIGAVGR
jgi:hypothetical protein